MPLPPDNAAELREIVQVDLASPVNDLLLHESAVTVGVLPDDFVSLLNLIDVDFDSDPCFAVKVTVSEELTADTLATKLAVLDPEATFTEEGILTAPLLLARLTSDPVLGAAELNPTVQLSEPVPVIEAFAQSRLVREAFRDPLPRSLIVLDSAVDVLLAAFTFSSPEASVVSLALK